ncbi:MAG: single-stranded DNA-binding protein [Thermoprotei archaeon]|nr:MAG: single-stranded DNA-binding protein [Thermoprotei archaeon]RLF19245.1 MAG: single-stranded DNA-binding protein [Thermoprotei archaeon]
MGKVYRIADLKPGDRRVNVRFKVLKKMAEREVFIRRDFSRHRVAELLVGDDSGTIVLTLWDDNIDKVQVNESYRIENGYVTTFRGSPRLNVGRYGRIIKE